MDLKTLTIGKARELLIKRELSSEELTRECFGQIRERDNVIHAFLEADEGAAIGQAREADQKLARGEALPALAGIPGAIKDNILVKGSRATAASKILEHYVAPYDATVVRRLREDGAVILGKTNLDEFAMGSSTENSGFGHTRNPHDHSRVPGGSSGGSAAAVADGMALWALGSDTGGSIRQPAGFCGVVGLKPTYGSVSRYGLIAMASSLDQIGPFAKTVQDTALIFEAIAGYDAMDATSAPNVIYRGIGEEISNAKSEIRNLRIGVPKEYFVKGIESAVEHAVRNAIKKLEKMGAEIHEISLPHTKYALPCYYIIQPAEVSANLARYDGIRYGGNKTELGKAGDGRVESLDELYFRTRGKGFGAEVKRRILLGAYVLSAGYYDAFYAKAQKVRRLISEDFLQAFRKVDVMVAPVSPTLAFKFGERAGDPVSMYLSDICTVSASLAGLPALSIPCGSVEIRNEKPEIMKLPIGLQIIGKHYDEKTVLQVGNLLEQEKIQDFLASNS